jgi:hypothetical protein
MDAFDNPAFVTTLLSFAAAIATLVGSTKMVEVSEKFFRDRKPKDTKAPHK